MADGYGYKPDEMLDMYPGQFISYFVYLMNKKYAERYAQLERKERGKYSEYYAVRADITNEDREKYYRKEMARK